MITVAAPPTETREELFTRLYQEAFPGLARYVSRQGGSLDETRDAFQEALLIYYEKVEMEGLEPRKSRAAYLSGIAKNIYLKNREQALRTQPLGLLEIRETREPEPATEKILSYLRQAGKKCMDLLGAFYYEKLSMNELAGRFGYASERSATVAKYKCLEKVRESVKEKSLEYEDFLD